MSPDFSETRVRRVYVDASVFSACEDEKYWIRESSRALFERFRAGDMTLVLSAAVAGELDSATEAARALPGTVPPEHSELLEPSAAAEELADRYVEAGAVDAATRPVALHVAFATLANVDTLASWNYKHLLNYRRGPRFDAVNRELGHPRIMMYEPPAILGENFRDPNDKSFDCVAFQREQRDRINRKLEAMTPEERVEWRNNREITDPSSVASGSGRAKSSWASSASRLRIPERRELNGHAWLLRQRTCGGTARAAGRPVLVPRRGSGTCDQRMTRRRASADAAPAGATSGATP